MFWGLVCLAHCTIPWHGAFHLVSKWVFLPLCPTQWLRSKASYSVQCASWWVFFFCFSRCAWALGWKLEWWQVLWVALVLRSRSFRRWKGMRLWCSTEDPRFCPSQLQLMAVLWSWTRWQMFSSVAMPASISNETTTKVVASMHSLQDTVIHHRTSLETASQGEGLKYKTGNCPSLLSSQLMLWILLLNVSDLEVFRVA